MTAEAAPPRPRKFWRYCLLLLGIILLSLAGFSWYATTDAFQARVRRRVVDEIERVTGGKVELGGFHTIPFRFRVEIRNLTIHGKEAPSEIPYAHFDRLLAKVKIISVLGAEVGFDSLVLEHPVIHIITYPDGTTNQPVPKIERASRETPVEQLFALSIGRLEFRQGMAIWNDKKIPLDFDVNDVSADMSYSLLHRRYDTNLLLGKASTRYQDFRPTTWTCEAHFYLYSDSVDIRSVNATSGHSKLTASGKIEHFRDLLLQGKYDVTLDLQEAGAIAHYPALRRGTLQAAGEGKWSAVDFKSEGKLLLKELQYNDDPVNLRDAAVDANYSVTPQRLTVSQINGRVLGGSVAGDVDVVNWLTSPVVRSTKAVKGLRPEEQKGSVRLRFKDFSTAVIASVFSTRARPFNRLNLAGLASGTVEGRWIGKPQNIEPVFALDLTPPSRLGNGQLPLSGRARGSYRPGPGELAISELALSTRATQIRASGTLSSTASLRLGVTTTDLSEWQNALALLGHPERLPVILHGHATFNGSASGKVTNPALAGNLQVQNFDSIVPATERSPERQIHWDSLTTDVQASRQAFSARNGTLHHGDTSIRFDVTANLDHGEFTPSSQFTARVNMRQADASEILALAGYDYPISGKMNLHLLSAGTKANPHAEGRVQIRDTVIYGEPVQHFSADLRYANGDAELNNILATHYEATVTGGVTYNAEAHNYHFNLTGKDFDLLRIPSLQQSKVKVEGRMDFTANGSGTMEAPAITAAIRLRDLTLDGERSGNFVFDATTQGADLHLVGHSEFEHAELSMDGNIHLRGDWPSQIRLDATHLDVDSLLRTYFKGRVTGHSAVAGQVELQGPMRRPRELSVKGDLSDFYADIENIKVRNNGPVRFSVNNELLHIDQLRLIGEGTDLSANGSLQLTGDRAIDLRAQGSVNLQLIETFNPDFTSSGVVSVDVSVNGSLTRPVMQGRVQIVHGAIAYAELPSGLSEINGALVFNQNRLQIETLTARTGGGAVTFSGYATTYNHLLSFDLNVTGQGVRLRYPPGVSSTADADLHFVGTNAESTLSGDIVVNKLAFTPGFDFGAYLQRTAQQSALPQTNPLLNRIRMDVHIVTAPELQMQTAVVRLSGDADLRLRGTAAKPVLLGRADILEGEAYFNGAKYRLERGEINFSNPVTTTPVLDLQAATRVRDYDITINVNGEPDKLHVIYRSEPPLPESDVIALLALGRTQEESAQIQASGQTNFNSEASSLILTEALNATISNRAQRLFGVSRIKIDPQGLSTETTPIRGPQVTIEQQVANNLTLTYSTNVSQASQQIIQVEYNVSRNVSIVGIRDQNGVVSFDVRIRQRKK